MQPSSAAESGFDVGLDIAKAKVDVCLRLPTGKLRSKVVNNAPAGFADLVAWLSKHGAGHAHVCLEATGVYWEAIAEYLSDAGYTVSVVNPAQVKAYGAALGVQHLLEQARAGEGAALAPVAAGHEREAVPRSGQGEPPRSPSRPPPASRCSTFAGRSSRRSRPASASSPRRGSSARPRESGFPARRDGFQARRSP